MIIHGKMQLFSEEAIEKQSSRELRKGIRNFEKRIADHKMKNQMIVDDRDLKDFGLDIQLEKVLS